jgi:hypothetical protein
VTDAGDGNLVIDICLKSNGQSSRHSWINHHTIVMVFMGACSKGTIQSLLLTLDPNTTRSINPTRPYNTCPLSVGSFRRTRARGAWLVGISPIKRQDNSFGPERGVSAWKQKVKFSTPRRGTHLEPRGRGWRAILTFQSYRPCIVAPSWPSTGSLILISKTFPVIVRYPVATRPVGSAVSDVHDTASIVARILVGALALLSNVDSVIREPPGIEVSMDAQDQDGARYGDAFTACASQSRHRGKSPSHSPTR